MDDFKNLDHIKYLNQNFLQYYFDYNYERTFEKGLFQPFYLLQMYFQYFIQMPLFVYIQNLIITFISHYLFLKGLNKFIQIEYPLAFLIFLNYPFTNDLFVHLSLQKVFFFARRYFVTLYKKIKCKSLHFFLIA